MLCDLFLLSDLQRAVCVAVGTGVSVTCRSARRAVFCVDSVVCLVILLFHQAHTGLLHTLGCRGQFTRPRHSVCVHAVERHATLTRRHTTLPHDSLADYSTRSSRHVQAPIRQRDCSARPPRRPPWQLSIAPAAASPGTQQRRVSRRADSGTCGGHVTDYDRLPAAEVAQKVRN